MPFATRQAATVKAPRVRLADFARVHIPAGTSKSVTLTISPKYHSVIKNEGHARFWHPTIAVEAGSFTVHVGGGQPDFAAGVLSSSVAVETGGALSTQYRCE